MTIFQPNLTFRNGGHQAIGFQVQSESWMYESDACGRPPAEVQQRIICGTCFITKAPYITGTAGGDWDLFSPCCPFHSGDGTAANKQVYFSARNCTQNYCLTNDEALGNSWDQCVKDQARKKADELRQGDDGVDVFANQTVDEVYCGRCEFLNHDFLKNGLQKSGSAASTKGTAASTLLIALLVATMLL